MAIIGNEYERAMAHAFKLEKYMATEPEKLALADLATDLVPATDMTFGEGEATRDNFEKVFAELLMIEGKEETHVSYEALWKIRKEAIMDFASARLIYENSKIEFDQAYELVLKYMQAKYPEMTKGLAK